MAFGIFNKDKEEDLVTMVKDIVEPEAIPNANQLSEKYYYRYRENHGVNLGSCFVLEPWIFDNLFDKGGSCEFDAITNLSRAIGVEATAQRLNQHYSDYINKIDWIFLKNVANITALRVPIGYWHVNNGSFLGGLPFQPLQSVYSKAKPWDQLRNLISIASKYRIGILIDIHGLPGGANTDFHSGFNNPSPSFFSNGNYVNAMTEKILPFIVQNICSPNNNVIGLQIVNESVFDNNANGQKFYYAKAAVAIRKVDSFLPVIISDGWWPGQWGDWLQLTKLYNTVVVDTHVYRCYSDSDKSKNAGQIINDLAGSVNLPNDRGDFVVGEFSCVLDQSTWNKTQGSRSDWVRKYGNAQVSIFRKEASWGSFFWTLKFRWGDGGEWGFIPMTNQGCVPKRSTQGVNIDDNKVNQIIQQHISYWKDKGGEKMEHWRFQDAIRAAVNDIRAFSSFDNSRIGRWYSWKAQRRQAYIQSKGDSEYMWEWDQGYQQGLDNFNRF
ncbi:hypothetical protein TBLA_0E02530 [Henningerozyma blattae CBS 6284]|uniref:Glycoside hydrolase family 5 domain-containing protein n=1 Tax=Henningerozyma blattae (strain ATCC 34711 / CBS 6284 / DSM 70876 / NBRC 10599 / NRRL Y-10934 / UCD 77-7) TaxID=1071380 RepID=I2H4K5_HENB6|nr:hypothetical protein TBLA_0E02530 [Tetrapisispora blattae CBS 6284]CCH61307.1 hypothetical protein TBLA_0E02530 [Tetrapisispora blattae CBS 6284]